jgi:hypothetical protein
MTIENNLNTQKIYFSIRALCIATIANVKAAGCSCFKASFPNEQSIPVEEVMPCTHMRVPHIAYSTIQSKIYEKLHDKLCGDELVEGRAMGGQCPQRSGLLVRFLEIEIL